jgi:hypothetical protein
MQVTDIQSIFDPTPAYIYIWISHEIGCVYVGQTNGDGGVVGRAGAHVKRSGTLRERVLGRCDEQLESAKDWLLLSFVLPAKKNYTGAASSYREAVEYLVQTGLNEIRGDLERPFVIVSNINYSDYCRLLEVQKISSSIIQDFLDIYTR